MKNGFFYAKFLLVLLGLIGFANMKAAPIVLPSSGDTFTIYQMGDDDDHPDGRTGQNGHWYGYQGQAAHGSFLQWTNVSVSAAGTYDLTMQYCDAGQDRYATVQINNQEPAFIHFGEGDFSSDWDTNDGSKTVQVYLDAGNNTILISAVMNAGLLSDGNAYTPLFDVTQFTINPSTMTLGKLPDATSLVVQPQDGTLITVGSGWHIGNFSAQGGYDNLLVGAGYDNDNSSVEWDVTIPAGKAGTYNLIIDYCNGSWDDRFINLLVNDGIENQFAEEMAVPWAGSGNWGEDGLGWIGAPYKAMTQFYLHDGLNTIKVVKSSDGSEFSNFVQFELNRLGTNEVIFPKVVEAESTDARYQVDEKGQPDWQFRGIEVRADRGSWADYTVNIPTAGTYDVTFIEATRQDRSIAVQVNNQLPVDVRFGGDNWSSDWGVGDGSKTIQVYFDAGDNKFRISGYENMGDGMVFSPSLDKFTIVPSAISVAKLPDAPSSIVVDAQNTVERTGDFSNADKSFMDGDTEVQFHGMGMQHGSAKYEVTIPEAGLYTLVMSYASWNDRYVNLVVNGGDAQEILVTGNETWGDNYGSFGLLTFQAMTKVDLSAGVNTFELIENTNTSKDDGWYPNLAQFTFVRWGSYAEVTPVFPKVIEAENADESHMMFSPTTKTNSDGVDWVEIGGDAKTLYGSYLQYNVTVEEAGTYDLTLQYADAGDDREMWLKVNDQVSTIVHIGEGHFSTSWDNNDGTITVQVYLEAGANTLTLGPNQIDEPGNQEKFFMPNLDKLIINPSETSVDKLPAGYSFTRSALDFDDQDAGTGNWDSHDVDDAGLSGISGNSGYTEYNVDIPSGKGGLYTIVIDYYGASDRYFTLLTNEGKDNEFSYQFKTPSNGTWGGNLGDNSLGTYKVMALVNLTNGVNTLKILAGVNPDADGGWSNNISSLTFIKTGEYAPDVVVTTIPVTGVSLDATTASLAVGDTQQLTATIQPGDAMNQNVSWSSSNETVATVSANGLITAVSEGSATITVTSEDGGKTATCAVTVILPTGISKVSDEINAYSNNGRLYVNSPVAEIIHVYSVDGVLLYNFQKPAGMANYSIEKVQGSVLIVRGDTGWVKKVIR